ncbi:uncharacterized protein DSM5745_03100 [Aspergillus mulundensis]|uniref:Uncharacterized protein n=1 Tax=Aspergillus mulundensis TaxID=1810919 RepID=A0A3D8SKY5_9EURO|nr:hypothetical protein DSM5745_03100 [Aspergillus mulundensis]RDW86458.1 hypothetical protein DSM5745_03100 [Aspergillus mulundensis]
MGGKLPGPHPDEHAPPDRRRVAKNIIGRMDIFPERRCLSPLRVPEGLLQPNGEVKPGPTAQTDGIPSRRIPEIHIGDDSPTPRWLIRPAPPAIGDGSSGRPPSIASTSNSTTSTGRRLPALGVLRWEFDPGSATKHQQDETKLYEYAYRYLQSKLCDPIAREELRDMIWDSDYAPIVEHVEDPLPVPPPPKKNLILPSPSYEVSPKSSSDPVDYHFMYPDYARPSLASRLYQNPRRKFRVKPQSSADSRDSSDPGESSRTRGNNLKPGEFKWIWITLTVLILALFLCLFLYVFGILK